MNAVEKDVEILTFKELNSANDQFPLFHSQHEGYAVIKEEIEEAMDGMNGLLEVFSNAWAAIKKNEDATVQMKMVGTLAQQVAIEAIQVAAMCDKFNMSLEGTLAPADAQSFADLMQPAT